MFKRIGMFLVICFIAINVYADTVSDANTVQQGAVDYDWSNCLDTKLSNCLNGCENSEDIHCSDNCKQDSYDKCKAQGFKSP